MDKDLTYSQVGQDLWVMRYPRFFIEAGAHNGIDISNTYLLEQNGWQGICVEPGEDFKLLEQNRKCVCVNKALWKENRIVKFNELGCGSSISQDGKEIEAITFKTLLEDYKAPRIIDYISLDVEGAEYDVLSVFPFDEYEVLLWTIEHNQAKDGGKMRDQIRELMTSKGYKLAVGDVYCGDDPFEDWWVNTKYNDTLQKR